MAHKDMPTPAQFGLLMMLSAHGSKSLKDLAECFTMSPSAATQLVDGLVKDGLVRRTEDENDRRKVEVSLTPAGVTKLQAAQKSRLASLTKMMEPLTDAELAQLRVLQKKITDNWNVE